MKASILFIRFLAVGLVFLTGASVGFAQSVGLPMPRLLTTVPMGGKVGTEFELTVTGDYIDDADALIFSDQRITAKNKLDANGKPILDKYMVRIASDCPPGLFEARMLTRLGASSSRIFVVDNLTEILKTKPNNSLASALDIPLNSVCNGNTTDRSIDYFKINARKGQRLMVDCATRGIDSKLNATLVVADAAGRDLLVERSSGLLDFSVPKDGDYVIKVHELTFKGGPAYYYRLAVREVPAGAMVTRQASTKAVNSYSWPPVGLAEKAKISEVEPNNDGQRAQKITLPCDIAGSFFPAADVDVFEFNAKKGEIWWIELASERMGLPTDPAILVQQVVSGEKGAPGKVIELLELADIPSPVKVSSNGYAYDGPPYDAGTSDILGKLVIKEDGVYRLQLSDLFGGTRNIATNGYRLVIRKPDPDFALVAWAMHMELRNGDRNALSKPLSLRGGATVALEVVAFRRDGFEGEIEISMDGLPKGVTAQGLKIPAGQSKGMMLLTAAEDAPRGYANAKFVGKARIAEKEVTHPCHLASVAWPISDSWGEIPSTRLLADVPVSVSGMDLAPITITANASVIEVKAGEKITIPLTLKRRSDFSGDKIQMRAVGAGFERAPGFDVPIKSDSAQVILDLAALKVLPGEYKVSFLGGAVVKYRHKPELVASVEATNKKMHKEVKDLEAEVKKVTNDVKTAPPEKKEQMTRVVAAMNAKMKAANDALNASQGHLKKVTEAAQPKDIADIVVCEPITIRVKPAEKK